MPTDIPDRGEEHHGLEIVAFLRTSPVFVLWLEEVGTSHPGVYRCGCNAQPAKPSVTADLFLSKESPSRARAPATFT